MQNQTQWGTGQYGGMQSCNVPQLAGVSATNVLDEVRELLGSEKDLKRELDKEVTELKRVIESGPGVSIGAALPLEAEIAKVRLRIIGKSILRANAWQTKLTRFSSNVSVADSTIFRAGTNFAIQMSNGSNAGDWTTEEWLTFEGDNYVTVGTPNANLATPKK